jgi:hypothetical protein
MVDFVVVDVPSGHLVTDMHLTHLVVVRRLDRAGPRRPMSRADLGYPLRVDGSGG